MSKLGCTHTHQQREGEIQRNRESCFSLSYRCLAFLSIKKKKEKKSRKNTLSICGGHFNLVKGQFLWPWYYGNCISLPWKCKVSFRIYIILVERGMRKIIKMKRALTQKFPSETQHEWEFFYICHLFSLAVDGLLFVLSIWVLSICCHIDSKYCPQIDGYFLFCFWVYKY